MLEHEEERQERGQQLGVEVPLRFPEEVDNFDNQLLRVTLPVAHLAVAAAIAIDRSRRHARERQIQEVEPTLDGPQAYWPDFLARRELIDFLLDQSRMLEEMLPRLEVLRPRESSVIRLRRGH